MNIMHASLRPMCLLILCYIITDNNTMLPTVTSLSKLLADVHGTMKFLYAGVPINLDCTYPNERRNTI